MTASFPPVRPGHTEQPQDALSQRVAALEKLVAETARKDLSNARIGFGSNFRASLSPGGPDVMSIKPGNPAYGARQRLALNDANGVEMYGTDELAGYGLSVPSFSLPMSGYEVLASPMPSTAGTALPVAEGENFTYNPCWDVALRLRIQTGANAATMVFVFTWKNVFTQNIIYTTSITINTGANVINIGNIERIGLLTAADMSSLVFCSVACYATAGASTTNVQAFPYLSFGASKAWYDGQPGLH